MSDFDCDLLVVGLGPVGDVLAGLAAQHGMSVIAIDKASSIHPLPRAAVFDHEIMRIFQMLGVADRIGPLCRTPDRYRFVTADNETLLDFQLGGVETVSGWAETYSLHQPSIEAVLRARLIELAVDVRTSTQFIGLNQDAGGVSVEMSGPNGPATIRARYVAGCDGASSAVREAIDAKLFDYNFDEPWLVVDVIADDSAGLPDDCMQICDPAQPVTYLAMSPPRYRWEFMLKPSDDPLEFASEENLSRLLAPWYRGGSITIERKAVYRFHGLVAESWRKRHVLLAGDAAHQMPPFAGQGMCSGIRDACNLAWKLARVVKQGTSDMLLDSYQAERDPHVRKIIDIAIAMGMVVCLRDPHAAAERNAGMLARKAAGAQDVTMRFPDLRGGCLTDTAQAGALFPQFIIEKQRLDDLFGPQPWLIGRNLPSDLPSGLTGIDLSQSDLGNAEIKLANWLETHHTQAVLVRPDRHIFGTGSGADLVNQWTKLMA